MTRGESLEAEADRLIAERMEMAELSRQNTAHMESVIDRLENQIVGRFDELLNRLERIAAEQERRGGQADG